MRQGLTNERRAILMERYATTRTAVLAEEFGVSYREVCRWASELGLKKSKDFKSDMSMLAAAAFMRRYESRKIRDGKIVLDGDKTEYMQKYFATTPNSILANTLGVNDRTIRRWASQLGLVKNREVMELHRRSKMLPTPEEWFQTVATVSELYPDGHDKEIMQRTGYSRYYICKIARQYGIRRSATYKRPVRTKKKYSPELIADMAGYFPTHTDKECAARYGIPKVSVQYLARLHKWNKSAEHVQKMYLHNAKAAQEYNRKMSNQKKQSV